MALKKSLEMCETSMKEEDESQEDIEKETAVIKIQMGFALQMQGKEKDASALYNAVLRFKPDDIAVSAVVNNNLLCLNGDQNIFDSKKRIKAATAEGTEQKSSQKLKSSA